MHSTTKLNPSSFLLLHAHRADSMGALYCVHPGEGTQVSGHGGLPFFPSKPFYGPAVSFSQPQLDRFPGMATVNSHSVSTPVDCPSLVDSGPGHEVCSLWNNYQGSLARLGNWLPGGACRCSLWTLFSTTAWTSICLGQKRVLE